MSGLDNFREEGMQLPSTKMQRAYAGEFYSSHHGYQDYPGFIIRISLAGRDAQPIGMQLHIMCPPHLLFAPWTLQFGIVGDMQGLGPWNCYLGGGC